METFLRCCEVAQMYKDGDSVNLYDHIDGYESGRDIRG